MFALAAKTTQRSAAAMGIKGPPGRRTAGSLANLRRSTGTASAVPK